MSKYREIWDENNYKFGQVKQIKDVDWSKVHYDNIDKPTAGDIIGTIGIIVAFLCLVSLPAWVKYLV